MLSTDLKVGLGVVGLLLLWVSASAAMDIETTPLAIVNGDTIAAHYLASELARIHSGLHDTSRAEFDVEKLVRKLVNERLMVQDACAMGLDLEPGYKNRVANFRMKIAVEQLLQNALPDTFTVSDEDISAAFARQFRKFHLFLLILKQKAQADSALKAIQKGAKLEDVSGRYAQEQYRMGGGDKGVKYWLELNEILRPMVDTVQVGSLTGPFPYRDGFALFKLLETWEADTAQLDTYRNRIKGSLIRERAQAAHQNFLQTLKTKYPVIVNDSLLNAAVVVTDSSAYNLPDSSQVMAAVADSAITLGSLRHKILHTSISRSPEMLNPMKFSVLEEMIQARLYRLEAIARSYLQDNQTVTRRTAAYSDSLLIMDYISQTVSPQIRITSAMEDTFYQAHQDHYHASDQVKISQITVADEDSARLVLDRLTGGADFTWMVRECSIDRWKGKNGDRGWVSLSEFPESVRQSLDTLKIGSFLGPYQTLDGHVLLKLTDRKSGRQLELAQVRGAVGEALKQVEFDRVLNKVLDQLRATAKITINHEALKALQFSARRGE